MTNQIHFVKKILGFKKSFLVLAIIVCSVRTNNIIAQNWDQVVKAVATDRASSDLFGYSVAISGDYAIVGANQEDHNAVGGQFLDNAGAAYILKNNSGTWSVVQKIVASDRAADDEFGFSVAISGDYAIVGAPRKTATVGFELNSAAGAAYVFKNTDGIWSQLQKILAADREVGDEFGYSVAISENHVIIGAPYEDEYVNGLSSASNKGSAYIYTKGETVWMDGQKIVGNSVGNGDNFGWSVGISDDYAVIGTPRESQIASGGGSILTDAGSTYIFRKFTSGTWTQMQSLNASDKGAGDEFGTSVAISGDYVIVGAMFEDHNVTGGANLSNAGSAYIFERDGGTWSQMDKIVASDRAASDNFGVSVSISGEYAIVGAHNEDEDPTGGNTLENSGSAYIFRNTSGNWVQANKIVASDRGAFDLFGNSVAISGDYAIVGAFNEDEDEAGGNTIVHAGSTYFFKNCLARSTDTHIACGSYTWIDGNTYTENNNSATFNITGGAASGCDSLITLNLTIYSFPNITTTATGITITANAAGASYQWIDCSNGNAIIPGATSQSFTATSNGSYAVIVTNANCTGTSDCQTINPIGIDELSASNIQVYPNPTSGNVRILFGKKYEFTTIELINEIGQIVFRKSYTLNEEIDFNINGTKGLYLLKIETAEGTSTFRVIKN